MKFGPRSSCRAAKKRRFRRFGVALCQREQQGDAKPAAPLLDAHFGVHLLHHGLDAGQAHPGALLGMEVFHHAVGKAEACPALFPDEAHLDILRRVGILEDVGGDIVQNSPDVLPLDPQQQVFFAKVQRAGKAPLLQRVHQLGQR